MARFMIKASEYKNVCKSVNDRKLAELKKEIIEILKKQDEKEVKKAIDYFNSQELHYTHLEKSFTGKWVEKAGYGIGTVRIWKGKKYKKIAPGKWARVFEKEGRGTNIAIGKLISRVQKIDNVEDLMAFVMQNKQRFVDENGVDLPVLDKLRAAVDERNGNVGSKGTSPKAKIGEGKVLDYKNNPSFDKYKNMSDTDLDTAINNLTSRVDDMEKQLEDNKVDENISLGIASVKAQKNLLATLKQIKEDKKTEKPSETSKQTDYYEDISEVLTKDEKRRINEKVEEYSKENEWSIPAADMKKFVKDWQSALKETDKHAKAEKLYEIYSKLEDANWHDENKKLLAGNFEYFNDKYFKNMYGEEPEEKPAEKKSPEKLLKEMGFETMEKVSYNGDKWEVAGVSLDSDGNAVGVSLTPDRQSGNLKSSNVTVDDIGKIKKEKPAEKPLKTIKSPFKVFADKEPVGTFEKSGDNAVVMDATKDQKALFDSLNKAVSKDSTRPFMTDCYYDGENIISTDGKRLVCIKAGDIGIEPGFVKVNTDGGKIKLEKFEKDFGESQVKDFPNYKRVMPDKNEQQVSLDSKRLKEKLKEMKKDGAYDKSGRIALEFKDGKVILDGATVGQSDAKLDGNNFITFNAEQLTDAIINNNGQTMFISDNPMKAVSISDGSSDIVIMPMVHYEDSNGNPKVPDYDENRAEKNAEREAKSEKKAAMKKKNQDYMADLINRYKRSVPANFEERSIKNIQEWSTEQLERMYKVANADIDSLMEKKEFNSNAFSSFTNKNYDMSPERLIQQNYAMKEHPAIVRELERLIKEKGGKIEKSLFDDFITDMLVDEVIEDEEEVEEDETEYNDYSAEQPELFNSTEFLVREALNRRYNCM